MTLTDLTRQFPDKARPIPEIPWGEVGEPITAPIIPGPPDLIPGLLPKRGQLLIAGPTDVGKSLISIEICSSLITGNPLWGEIHPTETASRILYILGEHYNDIIKKLAAKTRLPFTEDVHILGPEDLKGDKWLVSGGKQNVEAIQKLTAAAQGCDLIVFDPLAAFFTGADTENDNAIMRAVLESMSIVAQTVGASSLILAHMGKPTVGKDGQEYARSKYAIRGASAVEDAATNVFYMEQIQGPGMGASRMFSIRKRKYKGDAPDEYRLLRHKERLTHTMLDGSRPYVEAKRVETQQKYGRLQAAHPDWKPGLVMQILSEVEGIHINTIRNHLGAAEE